MTLTWRTLLLLSVALLALLCAAHAADEKDNTSGADDSSGAMGDTDQNDGGDSDDYDDVDSDADGDEDEEDDMNEDDDDSSGDMDDYDYATSGITLEDLMKTECEEKLQIVSDIFMDNESDKFDDADVQLIRKANGDGYPDNSLGYVWCSRFVGGLQAAKDDAGSIEMVIAPYLPTDKLPMTVADVDEMSGNDLESQALEAVTDQYDPSQLTTPEDYENTDKSTAEATYAWSGAASLEGMAPSVGEGEEEPQKTSFTRVYAHPEKNDKDVWMCACGVMTSDMSAETGEGLPGDEEGDDADEDEEEEGDADDGEADDMADDEDGEEDADDEDTNADDGEADDMADDEGGEEDADDKDTDADDGEADDMADEKDGEEEEEKDKTSTNRKLLRANRATTWK